MFALVALLFLINAFDQDVRPGVEAFSDFSSEQVPSEQNAYFSVIGLSAAVIDDPQQKGIEIVATHNQRVTAAKRYDPTIFETASAVLGPRQIKFKGDASKLCESKTQRCLDEYRRKASLIESLWSDNRLLVDRYHRLYDYPHYRETATESIYVLFSSGDIGANALVRAHIGLQAIQGNARPALEALRRDTRYQRLMLRDARTVIAKMIATARIKRNLTLLSDIIVAIPLGGAERQIAREIVTPFDQAEMDVGRAFRSEFKMTRTMLEISSDWIPPGPDSPGRPWWTDVANVFFKKNASINLMYERYVGLVELAELPPEKLVQELESGRAKGSLEGRGLGWHSVYNPLGKFMTSMVPMETLVTYIARVRNMDALRRLVMLQLTAKERGLSEPRLLQFLAQADHALTNPYTAEPAQWDAKSHGIYFMCLSEKGDRELMGHRVEVFLGVDGK